MYSIGFLHYDNLKCILWGSQALTEAEREECRKVRVHAMYKGAVSQPLIGSIYESNSNYPETLSNINAVSLSHITEISIYLLDNFCGLTAGLF